MTLKHRAIILLLTLVGVASLSACAEKGPVLVDIGYRPPAEVAAETTKAVVGVSLFKDVRGVSTSQVGMRSLPSVDVQNELVVQGTAADLILARFKDALQTRGFTSKDAPAWDMTAGNLKADGADVVIGGEIKALWVYAESRPLNVTYKADVQLRVSAADAGEKKIFRTLNLSSKLERQDVSFSFSQVESVLSEALSAAIDQLLNDEEFKKRIK